MEYQILSRSLEVVCQSRRSFENAAGPLLTLSFAFFPFPSTTTTCKSLILRSSAPRPSCPERKDKGKSTYKDFLGESETGSILFG